MARYRINAPVRCRFLPIVPDRSTAGARAAGMRGM